MYEYYFLFVLGFLWLLFAIVQDLRSREIANWLNFSLLAFALLYRAFVAFVTVKPSFFWWGLAGSLFFMSLAYLLYYGHAFAGGDAKLLMAFGPLIPFERMSDFIVLGLGFVFALFLLGSLYSLIYTIALIPSRWSSFKSAFGREVRSSSRLFFICGILSVVGGIAVGFFDLFTGLFFFVLGISLPFLYVYGRTVESSFFIKRVPSSRLTEGDWLVRRVRVGNHFIRPTVHGLTLSDISLLKRFSRSVLIKEGIPFSPAFFLAFGAMVFYVLAYMM